MPAHLQVELLAGPADGSSVELNKLRMELEAERHLRRETQQEALRTRQALEAVASKRRAGAPQRLPRLKTSAPPQPSPSLPRALLPCVPSCPC